MEPETDSWKALDAVISGWAYESATTAIGVLEEGRTTKRWISTEMLSTLDNFVKVVLFNERIFVTGCTDLKDMHFTPREAKYEAGENGRRLLDTAQIFSQIPESELDSNAVDARVAKTLHPVNIHESPIFNIQCRFPNREVTIFQETVYLDAYFIEYAIEQFGAERFKPVFPGEHLYLGLRQQRLAMPQATHTMADIPARRLRSLIRKKMQKLNAFVSQGAPMLPALPPIFVSRILHDCPNRADFVPMLLEIRNSPAMMRLRRWLINCWELSRSTDFAKRTKAAQLLQKLENFSPDEDISGTEFGIGILKTIKNVARVDPISIVEDIVAPMMKYLGGIPLSGLRDFGGKNADPQKVNRFLKDNFGDQFNRNEMDSISTLLELPEDLHDWKAEEASLSTISGRHDASIPPLGRPYSIRQKSAAFVSNAQHDFDELFKNAVPVTPEFLKEQEQHRDDPRFAEVPGPEKKSPSLMQRVAALFRRRVG